MSQAAFPQKIILDNKTQKENDVMEQVTFKKKNIFARMIEGYQSARRLKNVEEGKIQSLKGLTEKELLASLTS